MIDYSKKKIEVVGMYDEDRELFKCCLHLRCKSMYYSGLERPGVLHDSEVMTYWCDKTQETIGPENGDVQVRACQPDRKCCEM